MKTLLILILSIAANASNFRGGQDGGGGTGFFSTSEDIDKVASQMNQLLFFSTELSAWDSETQTDADLKSLFLRFEGESAGDFVAEVRATAWSTKNHCYDSENRERDASTQFHRGAAVCFNRTTLQRYSPEELVYQMIFLAFHEISHHYEASELVAQKFQNYIARVARPMIENNAFPILNFGHTANILPGGFLKVEVTNGNFTSVRCISVEESNKFNAGTPMLLNSIVIFPGNRLVVQGLTQRIPIACLDLSPGRCTVRPSGEVGTYEVMVGKTYAYINSKNPYKILADLKQRKICH